jgi:acetyl coenzyme A synthetase (ADP forming)-like protein
LSKEQTPLYQSPSYQDWVDWGRLILRDGSTATIRISAAEDREKLRNFFAEVSPETLQRRFLSVSPPSQQLIDVFCDGSDPSKAMTLVVTRRHGTEEQIVAVGSYVSLGNNTAEVAFAVDDALQGKGVGSQLLERLSVIAVRNGFLRFRALTQADNRKMIDVFRHSGFEVSERLDGGFDEIAFDVTPTESSVSVSEFRDRLFTAASIRPFFKPNAVAVVGASRKPGSIGYRILDELLRAGFHGAIYPVNPNAGTINSLRVYASVRELPEQVDLAILAVPRAEVLKAVDDCAARGVRALVVITAGFAETDQGGREFQRQLLEKVRGYGMRMIGPNCMGLLNTDPTVRLNASFSRVFPRTGGLAMSSQSGAIGLAVLDLASEKRQGLSTFVSVGNKADVSGNDLLQYWESDTSTKVILLYLESFGNPRRFARIARRVGRNKPIVAVKAGRSSAGRRAAGSHTAALAASDVATDALFHQAGVIRAETLDELFQIGAALESQPLTHGRRVGIITNAGGPGILCADACEASELTVPELDATTQTALRRFLPAAAGVSNPVDMVASAGPSSYAQAIEAVLASPQIDAVIVIFIPLERDGAAATLSAIAEGVQRARAMGAAEKPVLACVMSSDAGKTPLSAAGETLPVYSFPETAAKVLSKCVQYAQWKTEPEGIIPNLTGVDVSAAREIVRSHLRQEDAGWLSTEEAASLLDAFGIPHAAGAFAATADAAAACAERIGFPVAVKLASKKILHKTEVGGVVLNLANAGDVKNAFQSLQDRLTATGQIDSMDGVLVQQMVPDGVELMVGITTDPLFGPLIAFGLGGVHVEILGDVRFRITPLTDKDARSMIRGIRGYRLLTGYRGHAPADVGAVENILLSLSRMVEEIPEIAELDFNPLVALPPGQGCRVLDARIHVRRSRT